jgi:hypothetical protein
MSLILCDFHLYNVKREETFQTSVEPRKGRDSESIFCPTVFQKLNTFKSDLILFIKQPAEFILAMPQVDLCIIRSWKIRNEQNVVSGSSPYYQ